MTLRPFARLVVVLALLLSLAGCGGEEESAPPPREALEEAKKHLDDARSVHLTLATKSVPESGDGVLGATGTLTHQPAFKGTVRVMLDSLTAEVPVVSVNDKVVAKLPATVRYGIIDPADYGAPDPADFADPDRGISGLLLEVEKVRRTGQKRSGEQVVTTYTGTLPGTAVKPIIPSADAEGRYVTVFGIDEGGRLVTVKVTGEFFSGGGEETFDMTFDDYDEAVTITAP